MRFLLFAFWSARAVVEVPISIKNGVKGVYKLNATLSDATNISVRLEGDLEFVPGLSSFLPIGYLDTAMEDVFLASESYTLKFGDFPAMPAYIPRYAKEFDEPPNFGVGYHSTLIE